mgnify:CR=1 FL=1
MNDFSNFVIDVDATDLQRNRMSACIYCGNTTSLTRDHVIPCSWSGFKRSYQAGDTVKCCRECNTLLHAKPFFSISKRANYLANRYTTKYRKIINHPIWRDSEIKEMSLEFQSTLRARKLFKTFALARIAHCTFVSLEDSDLQNVKQQTNDDVRDYKILECLFSGLDYEFVANKFDLSVIFIKNMFLSKNLKRQNLINAFKWENKIPFDISVYKAFELIRKDLRNN